MRPRLHYIFNKASRIFTPLATLLATLFSAPSYGQNIERESLIDITFDKGSYTIDRNSDEFAKLSSAIDRITQDTLSTIKRISVASYASPEGDAAQNMELSRRRGETIIVFLTQERGIADSLITNEYYGSAWDRLREAVESSAMEHKDEVLQIIDNTPEESWRRVNPDDRWLTLVDSRNRQLMLLRGGEPYRYMYEHIFPSLRSSGSITLYEEVEPQPLVEEIVEEEPLIENTSPIEVDEPILETSPKTLLAVKSNLLYDLVSVINLELECSIKDKWSIAAEWVFPWWTSCSDDSNASSHRNTLQLLNGNIEAKYWLGDRSTRPIMTGWHIGLYSGGGLYDLEHNTKGYQGEFFIAAGVSGGYAHTINRSGKLRMEYSLTVGYMQTNYIYYNEHFGTNNVWHTIKERSGRYSWFGPTRAKVSLVWLLNKKTVTCR